MLHLSVVFRWLICTQELSLPMDLVFLDLSLYILSSLRLVGRSE
jgi:hypothetical protein